METRAPRAQPRIFGLFLAISCNNSSKLSQNMPSNPYLKLFRPPLSLPSQTSDIWQFPSPSAKPKFVVFFRPSPLPPPSPLCLKMLSSWLALDCHDYGRVYVPSLACFNSGVAGFVALRFPYCFYMVFLVSSPVHTFFRKDLHCTKSRGTLALMHGAW